MACVPFSFVNLSWLLWSLYQRPANALQTPKDSVVAPWDRGDRRGSSVWSPWGRNGINDIRFRRSANAVDAPWGRGRDAVTSPYTPWGLRANATAYSGVLAAIICVPAACARRPRGALGDLTALLLRCRCEPTAFSRRSFRSPWERRATARILCMHKVRAVAWRPRRPHGVQWRCHGDVTNTMAKSSCVLCYGWPGPARCQDISSHDIDLFPPEMFRASCVDGNLIYVICHRLQV